MRAAAPAVLPSHFKKNVPMSRKRQVALFLLGALGFALLGLVWFGIFSVLGLGAAASPGDLKQWERAYEQMSDGAVEATLVEHISLAARRLSASKPCLLSAASAVMTVVKTGCPGAAVQSVMDLTGSRVEAVQRSKRDSARAIADSLKGGSKQEAFVGGIASLCRS
jgi:hypothetical protein